MNVELAMAALEDAKANPARFDMLTSWHAPEDFVKDSPDMTVPPCGTTGCFAGFASLRAAPVGTKIVKGGYRGPSRIVLPGQYEYDADDTETYATRALDITPEQAGALFFMESVGEVEAAVKYLADNPDASADALWDVAR